MRKREEKEKDAAESEKWFAGLPIGNGCTDENERFGLFFFTIVSKGIEVNNFRSNFSFLVFENEMMPAVAKATVYEEPFAISGK